MIGSSHETIYPKLEAAWPISKLENSQKLIFYKQNMTSKL
jgi:hypothetical protein